MLLAALVIVAAPAAVAARELGLEIEEAAG